MRIPVHCAHDLMVELSELKPNPKNPNTHPQQQVKLLAKIIREQGWRSPITVSKLSGMIVRGHGRYEAAKLLDQDKVPVDMQDYESEAKEWADMVADNRIAELSYIDDDLLLDILKDIEEDIDIELAGFYSEEFIKLSTDQNIIIDEKEFDENIQTTYECPKCGYKWS